VTTGSIKFGSVLVWVGSARGAFVLYQQGQKLWMKANQADQGAQGEENVAKILNVYS
jgi:hypothetical protein